MVQIEKVMNYMKVKLVFLKIIKKASSALISFKIIRFFDAFKIICKDKCLRLAMSTFSQIHVVFIAY